MAAPSTTEVVDRAPISFGAWLGIILLFIIFGLVVLVLIGLSPRGDNYEARRAKERTEILKKLQSEANTELHSYAWVDKSKGIARIPIERAMELTLTELAQKTPAPANPIESPPPAGQQSPAPSPQSAATQTGAAQPSAVPTASASPSGTPKAKAVEGKDSENRNQPAAAANPPGAQPGTQPGASATPAATPPSQTAQPAVSPSGTPVQSPAGTPIPVPGKTP
jgi:hypothetical protein